MKYATTYLASGQRVIINVCVKCSCGCQEVCFHWSGIQSHSDRITFSPASCPVCDTKHRKPTRRSLNYWKVQSELTARGLMLEDSHRGSPGGSGSKTKTRKKPPKICKQRLYDAIIADGQRGQLQNT